MQHSKSVETYQRFFDEYASKYAQKDYEGALKNLDYAISECPVREALPALGACRRDLVREMTPWAVEAANWLRKVLGQRPKKKIPRPGPYFD